MPDVAFAVASRTDFRGGILHPSLGMTHLHLAALLGFKDVCRILLQRVPRACLTLSLEASVDFSNGDGERIIAPVGSTPLSSARPDPPEPIMTFAD